MNTVDYGIDLGNHRSYIAKADGDETVVIPNRTDNKEFLTSAVYINENGTVFVGDRAKNKICNDPKNGYMEFKSKLGSDYVYNFEASQKEMNPIDLSAEILKKLRRTVKATQKKDLKAAVITVPDDFTSVQTKATRDAARLAGFKKVFLLRDSIAAARAYGFEDSKDTEIWMIYDFGEDFSVSLVMQYRGKIFKINSHADSDIGGKFIDSDIVNRIFSPAVVDKWGIADFNLDDEKYLKQAGELKKAARNAKIDLSSCENVRVEIENFYITEVGDAFDFEYDMTRRQLDDVMEPYVDCTIDHCRNALKEINIDDSNVSKIILVGGSTLSPYVHERLAGEFDVPLEFSIDPKTVVVRGAARFAGTINYVDNSKFVKMYLDELERKFETQKKRYSNMIKDDNAKDNSEIQYLLDQIISEDIVKDIEDSIRVSKTDDYSWSGLFDKVNELEDILDNIDLISNNEVLLNQFSKKDTSSRGIKAVVAKKNMAFDVDKLREIRSHNKKKENPENDLPDDKVEMDDSSSVIYVSSVNSDKFHLPSCSHAKRIKDSNRITFSSRKEAIDSGRLPCGVCSVND